MFDENHVGTYIPVDVEQTARVFDGLRLLLMRHSQLSLRKVRIQVEGSD